MSGPGLAFMDVCRGNQTGKILVVEDEPRARESLSIYLQLNGFKTLVCSSGEEAISLALRDYPDLILMDLGLPGMSGIETARVIKQNGEISKIPIIALSGRPRDIWERLALGAGMSLYLVKPALPRDILKAIQRLLPPAVTVAGGQPPKRE
jgi:DNA-binding response OmpR family regulator